MTETKAPGGGTGGGGVRSVHNALTVLEVLAIRQPIGVSELARAVSLPKSSVQRTLRTLDQAGWAETVGEGMVQWRLTRKVFRVGIAASTSSTLPESARLQMTRLRDRYGETVHLTVPDRDHIIVIARIDGTNSLRTFLELGTHAPLLSTAGGRAMLSAMPAQVTEDLLDRPVTAHTPSTLQDPDRIREEIRTARERGYATNEAEWRNAIAAVAAPLVTPDGEVIGAISLSMPASSYQELDIRTVGLEVARVCREIAASVHHRL